MTRWTLPLAAIAFVGTSVLTAAVFHRWEQGSLQAREESAFTSTPLLGRSDATEADRCHCTRLPHDSQALQFETAQECGEKRRPWANEIDKMPPIFRDERARWSADFPRLCLTYMMREPFPRADRGASFGKCVSGDATLERTNDKPCVTESYVNTVYNLFGDVTSCFGIPQKDFLPEIFYNSGFHLNALGSGLEAGLGFLRAPALLRANKRFDEYKKQIITTDSEACRRLAPYVAKLEPVQAALNEHAPMGSRCGLMQPPSSPLLNLFYMAIRYDQNRRALTFYMQKYEIDRLLKQAGLDGFEKEQLDQMLLTLASHEGVASSVILLKNYLQSRIYYHEKSGAPPVKVTDFDFQLGFAREDLRQPAQVTPVSFPAYLAHWNKSERGSYLSAVADSAQLLNSVFKEGTCVSDSYLSLSP